MHDGRGWCPLISSAERHPKVGLEKFLVMKKFLPTPVQAKRLIIVGGVLVLSLSPS
jgi:hypothetical protein